MPELYILPDFGVPKWIVNLHQAFADWWTTQHDLEHGITVILFPRLYVPSYLTKVKSYGLFAVHSDDSLTIALTCKPHETDLICWPVTMLRVFAHELVHYEQYRDGRTMGHRGVEKREWSLTHKFIRGAKQSPLSLLSPKLKKLYQQVS